MAVVDEQGSGEIPAQFEHVGSFSTSLSTTADVFRALRTGLSVCFVHVDSPIVNAYVSIATEEAGERLDKGLPHTLEHLVFLGSEDYPYKGVLDTLANRAYARGTNAWTATDNTTYTVTTAGSSGLRRFLPIFLDHILFPTLKDAGFVTEVYHVTGEGKDAGVVYSEMQGRENGPDDLSQHRLLQLLYPNSGYCSETGGLMRRLRELDADQIRKYHAEYYRPENTCIVITGNVDHAPMLKSLAQFEVKCAERTNPHSSRPWTTPLELNKRDVTETILFPDEDESNGSVIIGFLANPISDACTSAKLDTLLMYLTDSSVSLLQSEFVECEEPLATDVSYSDNDFAIRAVSLHFESVATEDLNKILPMTREILKNHQINMNRMRTVIEQRRLRIINHYEADTADLANNVITHHLYGHHSRTDLLEYLDDLRYQPDIERMTQQDWQDLLRNQFTECPATTILAQPSAKRVKDLAQEENSRVAGRLKDPERLKECQRILDEAMKANNTPIPSEIIDSFPISPLDAVFPEVETAQLPDLGKFDTALQREIRHAEAPMFIQLDAFKSQFLGVDLLIDTTSLPDHLRMYLPVFLELAFASPIKNKNSSITPYEEVVEALNALTVDYRIGCGINGDGGSNLACGSYESQIVIHARVTPQQYAPALSWIHRALVDGVSDLHRISTVVKNMASDFAQLKRDAVSVAGWVARSLVYSPASNLHSLCITTQQPFIKQLVKRCKQKDASIIADLDSLRTAILGLKRCVHISGAVRALPLDQLLAPWRELGAPNNSLTPLPATSEFHSSIGNKLNSRNGNSKLVRMPATESGYFVALAAGPSTGHEDVAPLMVASEYLSTLEGPFWKEIRGHGLAYGCNLNVDHFAAQCVLTVYRAANVVAAASRARAILDGIISGTEELDQSFFEAARASVAYELVSNEETPRAAASQAFLSAGIRALGHTRANRELLAAVERVTLADVRRVCNQYLSKIFNPDAALMVTVAPPSKIEDVRKGMQTELGVDMAVMEV